MVINVMWRATNQPFSRSNGFGNRNPLIRSLCRCGSCTSLTIDQNDLQAASQFAVIETSWGSLRLRRGMDVAKRKRQWGETETSQRYAMRGGREGSWRAGKQNPSRDCRERLNWKTGNTSTTIGKIAGRMEK
jgi:hypothetical protein